MSFYTQRSPLCDARFLDHLSYQRISLVTGAIIPWLAAAGQLQWHPNRRIWG